MRNVHPALCPVKTLYRALHRLVLGLCPMKTTYTALYAVIVVGVLWFIAKYA